VVAGAAEANVSETLAACEVYRSFGARAVAVVSPFYYRVGQEGVLAYFREIAAHTPIDVTLYNIPAFASPIDVRSVQILAEYPRVIGIKDSSGDIAQMGRLIRAVRLVRPEFTFLTGSEAALVPMMLIGADGGTHATAGVVPELTRRLYDLAAEARAGARGALGDAVALQLQLIELIDAMVTGLDFPEGFRAGVELRGFRMGRGRQPISEAQQAVRTALKENVRLVMRKLGVEADGSF
jgi:4-hydroxy-tetrahydrodipicolinate synthase